MVFTPFIIQLNADEFRFMFILNVLALFTNTGKKSNDIWKKT